MAGMLPGVEAARRRRFHQSSSNLTNGSDSTFSRRHSICSLYAPTHDSTTVHLASSMRTTNSSVHQITWDESRLGAAAREAKRRLDERLQHYNNRISETKSNPSERSRNQQQVKQTKNKKDNSNGLKWLKLRSSWKSSDDDEECVVCLEQMMVKSGHRVMQLKCGHRFHTKCLVPWLETNAHCPCCRLEINSSS